MTLTLIDMADTENPLGQVDWPTVPRTGEVIKFKANGWSVRQIIHSVGSSLVGAEPAAIFVYVQSLESEIKRRQNETCQHQP